MQLKTLSTINFKNKRVIYRAAYDVPLKLDRGRWVVSDNTRLIATLPTLKKLIKAGSRVVIVSWLGRPRGKREQRYSLAPVAKELSELLKKPVKFVPEVMGEKVSRAVEALKDGELLMIENVRFAPGEINQQAGFAATLARLGEVMVFDAFAQAHRAVPSITGLLAHLPSVAGLLFARELQALSKIIDTPQRPFVAVIGGLKISDKISMTRNLIKTVDQLFIGGALAGVFLASQGMNIGDSIVDTQGIRFAARLLKKYPYKIQLPSDVIIAKSRNQKDARVFILNQTAVFPRGYAIYDLGPKTAKIYSELLKDAKTIFWNGPLGMFEDARFANGTRAIAKTIALSKAVTVVGGGETDAAISRFKLAGKFTQVTTGGGAMLYYLAHRDLPVLKYLIN